MAEDGEIYYRIFTEGELSVTSHQVQTVKIFTGVQLHIAVELIKICSCGK
jgi:hypothetical protein